MPEATKHRLLPALAAVMAALFCAPGAAPGKTLRPHEIAPGDLWEPQPERARAELVRIPGRHLAELAIVTENASGRTKWLSRDPLGEAGGLNLYGFVGNDPINNADYLGLSTILIDGGGSSSWLDPVEILPAVMEPAPEGLVQPLLDELNALISKEIGWHYVDQYIGVESPVLGLRTQADNDRWFNARTDWSLVPPDTFEDIFDAAFARSSVPDSYRAGIFKALVKANAEQQANTPTALAERSNLAHVAGAAILTLGGTAEFAAMLAIPGPGGEARSAYRLFSGTRIGRSGSGSLAFRAGGSSPRPTFYRRTAGLADEVSMADLMASGALPGSRGVTLSDRTVRFGDIHMLSTHNGRSIEFALTREKGRFRLYSGGSDHSVVPGGAGVRILGHTHPSGGRFIGGQDQRSLFNHFMTRLDAGMSPRQARYPSRVIFGPQDADNLLFYPNVNPGWPAIYPP